MKTDWASGFSDEQYKKMEDASALGRIAAVDDVASVAVGFLTNRSVTVRWAVLHCGSYANLDAC